MQTGFARRSGRLSAENVAEQFARPGVSAGGPIPQWTLIVLSSPFPNFTGGTELTASMLNLMLEQMRRQSRLIAAAPVLVNQGGDGWHVRIGGVRGVWAVAGRNEGNGRYAWNEAQPTPAGWRVRPGGRAGGGPTAAVEVNGRGDVVAGEILYLMLDEAGGAAFTAPLPPDRSPALCWARIDASDGTSYGWTEMTYERGQFVERPDGQVALPGSENAAVESNGLSTPVGSLVVLVAPDATTGRWTFEYGGSDPGFWAVLLRQYKSAVYTATITGATGGSWTLTFDAGADAPPGVTGGTVAVAADATAATVQTDLDALTGGDVVVTGGASGWTFALGGTLAGASGASLSGSGTGLTPSAATFVFAQTTTGRDLPYSDGGGGYGWVRAEFDAFGRLRPAPDTGSVWPTGLALEANATPVAPEGSVVWARPRTSGAVARAVAEDAPEFADWTDDELDLHLADVDLGDGWLADDGIDFLWQGTDSFWGELTAAPDASGLYPFRMVHLGGRDAVESAAESPDDLPTAAALRTALLSGAAGAVDLFEAPLSETDRAWVASRPGGRTVTGLAREVLARTGFDVGTVVRVHVTGTLAGGLEFTFTGPPLSLWATLGGETATPGTYEWTELDPPDDPVTGLPKAARAGTAAEMSGETGIEAGTVVYVLPGDAAATAWRFRRQPDTPEGGRDCRLLNWTTGTTAQIVAGAGDPGAGGRTVTVRFYPPNAAADLAQPGHYVGYRPPAKDYYVVPQPLDYHSDRVPGYLTAGGQGIAGSLSVGAGGLVVTSAGEAPPFDPPLAYRANVPASTYESYTPGFAPLASAGALAMSAGPKVVAGGGLLDLQNAVWASPTDFVTHLNTAVSPAPPPLLMKDGVTGTFAIPGVAGAAAGSITFDAGLFVSAVAPGARPALYTGTFLMYDLSAGVNRTVTVTAGVITDVT